MVSYLDNFRQWNTAKPKVNEPLSKSRSYSPSPSPHPPPPRKNRGQVHWFIIVIIKNFPTNLSQIWSQNLFWLIVHLCCGYWLPSYNYLDVRWLFSVGINYLNLPVIFSGSKSPWGRLPIVNNSLPTCPYRMRNGGMATSFDFINKLIVRLSFQILLFLVRDMYAQWLYPFGYVQFNF